MPESYWDRIKREKDIHRARLAAQPFEDKLRTLEMLRHRTLELGGARRSLWERSPTSNVLIFATPSPHQFANSSIQIGVLGVNPTLFLAINPSSQLGTDAVTLAAPLEPDSGTGNRL